VDDICRLRLCATHRQAEIARAVANPPELPMADDVTLLVLRYNGSDEASLSGNVS
jgi:hypothetical protein